jgi:hypothetical protein
MRNALLFLLLICVTAWAIPFKFAPMAVIGPTFPFATGGTVETYTDGDGLTWRAHSFTTTGTNEFVVTRGGEMEYLIVAGGGGGGKFGGGGGAGGMLTGSVNIATGTFDAIVGAGGAGTDVTGAVGENGQDSVFAAITAIGGGGGAGRGSGGVGVNGADGGSGGGGSASDTSTRGMGGAGVAGQGNNGGSSRFPTANLCWGSGGGGGAGAVGADGTGTGSSASGGKGGDGLQSDITGELKYYAGGGGGGTFSGATSGTAGTGGLGGGGAGTKVDANNGGDGAANTGGGGGGGGINASGGDGGSGIVVIRYRTEFNPWTPADTTTKLWIDFADTDTLTLDGSLITQVDDKSGEDLHFSSSSANAPTATNTLNSLIVAKFDGEQSLNAATAADWTFLHDGTKYRIWIVSRTEIDALQHVFGTAPFASGTAGAGHYTRGDQESGRLQYVSGRTGGGDYWARHSLDNYFPKERWNMIGSFADLANPTASARMKTRLDAGMVAADNTETATPLTANPALPARIGSHRAGSTISLYLTGSVAEIIIILGDEDGALDDKVWGYLAHKWGLAGNLPANHPYKNAPPAK